MRVVLSPDTTAPLVRVGIYYAVGPRQEPRERAGFAHLFEHLMFEGSENLGPGEYFELVTSNGGRFGARTLYDFTKFNATVPSHALELLLWAEADRMRAIRIDSTRFNPVREVVKNEIRQQAFDRPYGRFVWIDIPEVAQTKWENAHSIYGETPDGSLAAIDAATPEDARTFFQKYYSPDNAALAIYGDFDSERTLGWVQRYFGDIPRGPSRPRLDREEPRQEAERRVSRVDPNAPRPGLAIAYHSPPPRSPQYWAMGIIDQILVHGRDSWMYDALVRRRAITDEVDGGISARHGSMYTVNGPNFWAAFVYFDEAQSPDSMLAAMDHEIERLRSAPVDEEALGRAITKARANFYAELNAARGEGRTDMLGQLALFDDDPERINRIEAELRSVTPVIILATAREYLRPSNRTVLTLQSGASP
uniref:Peptidase PqqF n=1 Tax=uncultured bacterium F42-01 TaxID=1191438 RepID=I3VII7_9BACT|nr:peptidase PqqF [uncultured bacterium F42-01]